MGNYDWNKASEGQADTEKVPAGQHTLKIVKIVFGSKKNGPFISSNNDPQIMLIFADDQAREVALMVTLSEKAAFKLAGILKAAGANIDAMTRDGITPDRFADEKFANANLLGRSLTANVTYDDKGYADVKPLRPRPGQTAPTKQPDADEIPVA